MRREGLCVKIHIVQKGDTLWKIAKKYGVNFETLKKMNSQLSNPDMLMPGMKIKIPDNTSPSVKKGGNTKINFGTVKEVPISGGSSNVKESIKAETETVPSKPKEMPIVSPPPAVKEMPIQPMDIKKEKPVKEMPKMPYVAPQAIVKPVVPEIDINNYYLMNMAKMEMQTPPPMPIIKEVPKVKEKPVIKEKPIIKEKPKKMEKPMPKPQPMPMPKPQPMPQYMPEYCPPMIPYYDPCCPPVMMHPCMAYPTPYFNQSYMTGPSYHQPYFHQPYWGHGDGMEDSSCFHHGHHESSHMMGGHHGDYYPQQQGYHQGGTMSPYGQFPVQGTQGYYQHPGFGHYGFESSHYGMESSSHMMDHHYQQQQQQQQYIPFDGYIPKGCGCSDTGAQGSFYQPMNQYDQQGMSHSMGKYGQQGMSQPMGQYDQQGMSQSMGQYDQQGMSQSMGQYDQQGMSHSMGQYDQQGMSQPMGQYDQQGMSQPMGQYDQQGMSHSMGQYDQQGMGQQMGQYEQQGMSHPMYQHAAQQPFFQDSQFHQRYGGQQFETGSPSYNPDGQHVIPHIEPAAFDMPRTQEESSEQEGQS